MVKNFFITVFRNGWKHRTFSFLNIGGLSIGLSAAFLIFLYVRFELSYDTFNVNADRIYRVNCDTRTPTQRRLSSMTAEPMAPAIQAEYPEVERFARIFPANLLLSNGNKRFQESEIYFADPSVFSIFTFPLESGDPNSALQEPFTVVLSATASQKYFGVANPIGQTLMLTSYGGKGRPLTVTGVMKDIPGNAHFHADMFISSITLTQTLNPDMHKIWNWFTCYSYVLLDQRADPIAVQAKFPHLLEKYVGPQMHAGQESFTLSLEPLKDLYLHSTHKSPVQGNLSSVYIFAVIALFIIMLAGINYINLTTARAAERAKEIGVRKINGAGRSQLIVQFLGESLLQCGMAGIAALLISSAVLPLFNQLAGKTIAQNIFQHGQFGWLVLASISLGLLAGMYPAIVLSSLRPAQVLKGQLASGSKGVGLRRILVVGQFTIAIMLMAGTLIVYRQVHFMVHQPLGFDKENMLVIDYRDQGDPRIVRFQQALTGVPGIRSSSLSSSLPGYEPDVVYSQLEDRSGAMQTADLDAYFVDVDFLTQYQIPLVAGRGFSRDYPTDCPNAMVINEAAVAKLGYGSAKEAIGKRFSQQREGLIIGVVKDFHFQSLQQAIQPLTLRIEPNGLRCHLLAIHVAPRRVDMARVEQLWDQYFPERPFTFTYLQDSVDRQYDADQRLGQLCLYLSILAIVISCLGLLGLSSYSTLVRTKEIGIRKVFGASVTSIVRRLTRDFVRWVAVAFLVATPIAWYTMHQWLRHFAYQAPIGWGIYVSAGMLAVLIASLTVSVQAIKAARANPLRCLRTE